MLTLTNEFEFSIFQAKQIEELIILDEWGVVNTTKRRTMTRGINGNTDFN
jgi:hypothetical protein